MMRAALWQIALIVWGSAALALEQPSRFEIALAAAQSGQTATAAAGFAQLAREGHTGAQINMAVLLARGAGLPQDDLGAAYWAWRARLAGDRRAAGLADHLRAALPAPLLPDLADRLQADLTTQAQSGDHAALIGLGVVAADLQAPARPQEAYVWFALAAAFDVPRAAALRDLLAAGLDPASRRSAQEAAATAFASHCAALPAAARIATCPD